MGGCSASDKELKMQAIIFVKSEIDKYMGCLDLNDRGLKVFGSFQKLEFITKSKVNKKYFEKMIKHLLNHPNIYYANIDKYFGVKSDVKMFSLGTHFIFIDDLLKQAKEQGLVQVQAIRGVE